MQTLLEVLAKAAFGGALVLAFAALAQPLSPKRFAGVLAAAPSVALASLTVTVITKGPLDARRASIGMAAGAIAFITYCVLAPVLLKRLGAVAGSVLALAAWAVAAAVLVTVAAIMPNAKAACAVAVFGKRRRERPELTVQLGKLKQIKAKEALVRFAFGATTSAVAAVVSRFAGPVIGGTFLAFPAILLASLTLVAEEEGKAAARDEARGAAAGATGLLAFALVASSVFTRQPAPLACLAAFAAWVVVGYSCYAAAWASGHGADERQQTTNPSDRSDQSTTEGVSHAAEHG